MSAPTETSGHPLASHVQHPEGTSTSQPSSLRRKRTTSQSSDERVGGTKSTSSRRRPANRKEASLGPHTGSSRGNSSTMKRSASPSHMPPELPTVNYTRTGRISKAKKGLKVHNCECGRSYTRAEHLRRHQKNHAPTPLLCEYPECGKTFFRLDLLQRHQERHNEIEKGVRRNSYVSQGTAPDSEPQVTASVPITTPIVTSFPPQPTSYYPQTVSPLPEATTPPSHMKQRPYVSRQTTVTIPVQVDELGTSIPWADPFTQSPNYSSSSGYASPIPGTSDYTNMFANPPYGPGSSRTRTSSNASFVEPWGYPSHSPASATSTMAYVWPSSDKPVSASHPYINATSYPAATMPMAGGDPMGEYAQFGPKSMAQWDEEEQAHLFPEQSFGMGQLANTFPFEQYLDNYWRLLHPSFPVVHRPTFARLNDSPMLRAAMIAIGAQYSSEPSAKRRARILHDRCLKLLDKRDVELYDPDRPCDHQAVFLIEVFSQYRARRTAKTLSPRFQRLYQRVGLSLSTAKSQLTKGKLSQDARATTSKLAETLTSLGHRPDADYESWQQWIDLATQQRLFLCCYILEYQQAVLLARPPQPSMIALTGYDLPLPCHFSLWEAETPLDWAMAAQQYAHLPTHVFEIVADVNFEPLDHFQSLLLIAAYHNHFNDPAVYRSPRTLPGIDHLVESSPATKHALLTAQLLQVIPVRALLAVSGESWILSEKVPSPAMFQSLRSTLRVWLAGLWAPIADSQPQPAKDALRLSIALLQHAINAAPEQLSPEIGSDMALYFAVLVLWAVTVGSTTRLNASQAHPQSVRYGSHSPLTSQGADCNFPVPSGQLTAIPTSIAQSPALTHPGSAGFSNASLTGTQPTCNSVVYTDCSTASLNFLENALLESSLLGIESPWPRDVTFWQQGCGALLQWLQGHLHDGAVEGPDSVIGSLPSCAGSGRGGDGLGEVLDGVVAVLDKLMGRGWEGWAI
ncbi:uncharacterized protein EI97DRAFT_461334 [Westerdykella ornata]|uniref:C2H2-type domain-containing protein n=1 Tax=Westerdykella ornata TaxID=318751 RepID=A0A6A6J9R7_WESOR|nr:uncharacterized protein EI97DRAFT_461334 [Westerdykella ornata]KAF2273075.1 hypothetical protein EI97DRAFT_461334 [Westerdykella ornata]